MKKCLLSFCLIILIFQNGCKEENNLYPHGKDIEKGAPGQISNITVDNIPGGAVIAYKLPSNSDIQYVKAEYYIGDNSRMEIKSSKFTNSITIVGFGDTREYEIKLFCVDRMENTGEPVVARIRPLPPPILSVYENLKIDAAFGGAYIDFINKDKEGVAIHILTDDDLSQLYEYYVHYTEAKEGRFYVRGFNDEPRMFGMYVTDRWGNKSDTVFSSVTPYKESLLDKKLFNAYILPNDLICNAWGGSLTYGWNDDFTPALFVHSPGGDIFPAWFTFDIGVEVKLSRYKFYHLFMENYAFQRGNLKKWEVWGRNDVPLADGSWDGWIKLMNCESYKPSGLPVGEITGEDWEYLQNGEDFEFSLDAPPVRYIRFKIFETWGNMDFIHFTEFTFWGNIIE